MKHPCRSSRDKALREAMLRLLSGNQTRCDGRLTVTNLAHEAGVSRATANRATNILIEFRKAVDEQRKLKSGKTRHDSSCDDKNRISHIRAQQIQLQALMNKEHR